MSMELELLHMSIGHDHSSAASSAWGPSILLFQCYTGIKHNSSAAFLIHFPSSQTSGLDVVNRFLLLLLLLLGDHRFYSSNAIPASNVTAQLCFSSPIRQVALTLSGGFFSFCFFCCFFCLGTIDFTVPMLCQHQTCLLYTSPSPRDS